MSTHYEDDGETIGFADWFNNKLKKSTNLKKYFPLTIDNFFNNLSDGVILCKYLELINDSVIDSRAINYGDNILIYHKRENCNLAVRASQSLGCCVVNIGPEDIVEKNQHIVKGLVWQQIRMDLLRSINLKNHPNILVLMNDGESIEDFRKLTPEEILIRWVNYHVSKSENPQLTFKNFNTDLRDSEIYSLLLKQIAPPNQHVKLIDFSEQNMNARATSMLAEASKLQTDFFLRPQDVISGNLKLNLAFTADLFNHYPALESVDYVEVDETREEKSIRSWVNSLGVPSYVNDLKFDLSDGRTYNYILNILKPKCIPEKEIQTELTGRKERFNKINNCSNAIKYGKSDFGFSLVNIDGSNLVDNNLMFILAFLSQGMRYDFIKMLAQINPNKSFADSDILDWVNSKVENKVTGFKDEAFTDSRPIFELIDAIKPDVYKKGYVNSGESYEDKYSNAKYALSIVRKMGGKVFALPEDIVEHFPRPIMLLCASLMIIEFRQREDN